ncbi:HEPN/Toprim-associated domain-containing protein [Fibrella forsythiae]|uniref:HEPN/Toprim N-terminal domain-containing protein n=1 Tax=Fibrella forsythiae TaxID=2817061 RepID=A0ABS3JQ34_9BACT|nr:HEPN/Toprim-associated domain-containing protein [Fibrella forsythiae]MBO0952120.1 hypothetical protein [Fibrella forsythiae]
MGYYCELMMGDYPISSDRNEVNPYIAALFDVDDLYIYRRKKGDRNKIVWGDIEDKEENEMCAVFRASADIIKDRLIVLGFSYQRGEDDFYSSIADRISMLKQVFSGENNKRARSEISFLKKASYHTFFEALIYIFENKIQKKDLDNYKKNKNYKTLLYLFRNTNPFEDFPNSDARNVIRGLVEISPKNMLLEYDITEHLYSQLYDDKFPKTKEIYRDLILEDELPFEDRINEKIIILTEGSSDANILKRSLRLLYPHLSKYYSFMDFDNAAVQGGSGSLANNTKSFIGAGINNRIISLFDNDTAGYAATKQLSKLTIPENFRILHLPDIELASNYLTLGPTGLTHADINKCACSIELYFGKDVLMNNNDFYPIQWTGFEKGVGKYQGEIIEKAAVQQRFNKKLGKCESDKKLILSHDWEDMKKILQMIFSAFNE